ncbi:MAG TPA: SCP2 sterol-binding domain-containing protein, partial [Steroidobacteraceae bacterium]|nr:SCP2 sterol-binding domain-containing protein [Steroidobacteraceae bacterium]
EGKVLAIHVLGLPLSVFFRSLGDTLAVTLTYDGTPDAALSGSPIGLLNLIGAEPESGLRSGSVRIEGDAEIAQGFRDLLQAAEPDLEEELARVIGDVAARQVGTMARGAFAFSRRAALTFAENVAEYLKEESRDLPVRTEVEEFIESVDELRDDVDRIEARLALLEQRAGAGARE